MGVELRPSLLTHVASISQYLNTPKLDVSACAAPITNNNNNTNCYVHMISIPYGVLEQLQHDKSATFATAISIRPGIKRLAQSVRGNHARPRQTDEMVGIQHDVDATT